ncbi:hypothetical protein NQ314_002062 [Rhamnusium bicolor]|uniref:Myb-like domain-containing protein n=1 Tax=Rhamnusium bicolor TaxID=1586634 RepID=A0AAV8ZRV1_9CUCU|nr:hypothetical protein NQ314_002062 [Rhamnusium bicolor]
MEALDEFIIINVPASTSNAKSVEAERERVLTSSDYVSWTSNQTKVLIDLYKKYRTKVGTLQIRNLKKLWEVIAVEINNIMKINVSATHCENKWRVLDRGYKKYVDNQNKTGRGKKYFEFIEEMDAIFKKKKNIHPEILLSNESEDHLPEVHNITEVETPETTQVVTETPKRSRCSAVLNRNKILENMRKDRVEYQKQRLQIEQEKLEIQKQKLEQIKKRNKLIEERNDLLKRST